MTNQKVLHELEKLSHSERVRRLVEIGRTAADDAQVAATIAALERGDFDGRSLALHSCYGSPVGSTLAGCNSNGGIWVWDLTH